MARFDVEGLEELMEGLERLADIPDGTIEKMLRAQAKVVKAHQKRKLAGIRMKEPTGQTVEAIGVGDMKRDGEGRPCLHLYPQGKRRERDTRNAEVGYIIEYGAPQRGIAPRQWMRTANAEAEEEAAKAAEEELRNWQDSTGA